MLTVSLFTASGIVAAIGYILANSSKISNKAKGIYSLVVVVLLGMLLVALQFSN